MKARLPKGYNNGGANNIQQLARQAQKLQDDMETAAAELEACMNNAYKDRLKVPMKAVGGIGDNWNGKHAEDDWQKLREKYGLGRSGEHDTTARIIN